MVDFSSPAIVVPAGLLLCTSLFAVRVIHVFAYQNGMFPQFFELLQDNKLPSGKRFQSVKTNGWLTMWDQQISAFALFMLSFTEDFSRPDTTLSGLLFAGAWAPAWALIVLESFRAVNSGAWLSYLALPGYIIFHQSHGFGTPLFLCLVILFLPSSSPFAQTPEALSIEYKHLRAIPPSFLIGYVIPIIMLSLPSPGPLSLRVKHTINGWYQQWHLVVEAVHYIVVWTVASTQSHNIIGQPEYWNFEQTIKILRMVYLFIFALAAVPYWTVMVITVASYLAPRIFNQEYLRYLHPKEVLIPMWPRKGIVAKNLQDGTKWLIQWDFIVGTAATSIWAFTLRTHTANAQGLAADALFMSISKAVFYFLAGGPVAVPIGFMWERDELVYGNWS